MKDRRREALRSKTRFPILAVIVGAAQPLFGCWSARGGRRRALALRLAGRQPPASGTGTDRQPRGERRGQREQRDRRRRAAGGPATTGTRRAAGAAEAAAAARARGPAAGARTPARTTPGRSATSGMEAAAETQRRDASERRRRRRLVQPDAERLLLHRRGQRSGSARDLQRVVGGQDRGRAGRLLRRHRAVRMRRLQLQERLHVAVLPVQHVVHREHGGPGRRRAQSARRPPATSIAASRRATNTCICSTLDCDPGWMGVPTCSRPAWRSAPPTRSPSPPVDEVRLRYPRDPGPGGGASRRSAAGNRRPRTSARALRPATSGDGRGRAADAAAEARRPDGGVDGTRSPPAAGQWVDTALYRFRLDELVG